MAVVGDDGARGVDVCQVVVVGVGCTILGNEEIKYFNNNASEDCEEEQDGWMLDGFSWVSFYKNCGEKKSNSKGCGTVLGHLVV